jgi:hypothetical protein
MSEFTIVVVPDQPCPGCGAYSGHPDPRLDYPNRIKVNTHWKCYNPACEVGYYEDGVILELKSSPDEAHQIMLDAQARVDEMMKGKVWVKTSPEGSPIESWEMRDAE